MTRELVIQKGISFALVALAIAYLSPLQIGLGFSVLGQGHFLGAYYYQWKAGKIKPMWFLAYAVLAMALFTLAIATHRFEWFALGAGVLFFTHHFQDEVTLFGKERSFARALEQIPPIALYSTLTADALFGISSALFAVGATLASLALYALIVRYRSYTPDALSVYLWLVAAGLIVLWTTGIRMAPEALLGSVILFHYICWYVHFYFRFANDKEKQHRYVREMLTVHAIVFGFYAVFVYTTWGSLNLGYIFLPIYFYIWAILHIVFSVRLTDYRAILRW